LSDSTDINARARRLDLGGEYVLPPGDPISHFGAGFAKILCSNVFLAGLESNFAAEHNGFFTAPYEDRSHVKDVQVDVESQSVHVALDNGVTRTARICGSQGAVAIPLEADDVSFTPSVVESALPPANTQPWPIGDLVDPYGGPLDRAAFANAVDLAFGEGSMTSAVVVTHRGALIAERYAEGIEPTTPLESWSMGKSLTATLLGLLVHEGEYALHDPAPIPEWQSSDDDRASITIADIVQMSSGLRFRAMMDPDYDPRAGYPDHLYVYTGGVNAYQYAATRPQQWPAGQVGRYRNGDPLLANYLVRLAVEARGENYHAFPQHALFDQIGIRNAILETDPFGNFLLNGYEFISARDWARLANLYLQDGVVVGKRLLPEGWSEFVSTPAPGWVADGRPIYGGFFWLNRGPTATRMPIPEDAYFMAGAGGQKTIIVPSRDLVVVRIGHFSGASKAEVSLGHMLAALMELVPEGSAT
jgi:CubicO group peptidase (beta-lactamase class C family)